MMENKENNGSVLHVDIVDEMKQSYIEYSMSVIVGRALPDVRDGLKPVHRRILHAMNDLGFSHDKPHRKSARIVGEVIGKYHPHGDSSIYNAMVRFAQDFSMRYMLVDGHGNFGSVDGDQPAAMRYTEARMAKLSAEMLRDIDKDTVDFVPNFDDNEREPNVLPSRFPNLLVNGSNGIAVGMATSIPPHHIGEVIDATVYLIDHPDASVDDLMNFIKGPDFPTGADIIGTKGIRAAYLTGRGRAVVRSVAEIVELPGGRSQIVVTEIPYQINKAKLVEDIAALVKEKRIDGITGLRDESSRTGIRIVIDVRRDVSANVILNQLYKKSQLQSTFGIIMLALVGGVPKILNLKDMLEEYVLHQVDVETRRVKFDLKKALDRIHILEGLRIAIDNIDEVIRIIRSSYNDAEERLMERFQLSAIQAKAIVDMRLRRLQGLEREKIEEEYNNLLAFVAELRTILEERHLLMNIIKEHLLRIKEEFQDERRTKIVYSDEEIDIEDMIEEENVVISLTNAGYMKRVPVREYMVQKRGGRGKTGLSMREEDFVKEIYTTNTHDNLLFFTNFGRVYTLKAYQIPEASRTAKGTAIVNLLQLGADEKIAGLIPIKANYSDTGFINILTKHGTIKKTDISNFHSVKKNGKKIINIVEGDELISVRKTTGSDDIFVVTKDGMAIRFHEDDIRVTGTGATGVRAIRLEDGDETVGMDIYAEGETLMILTENGFGKRTNMSEYRIQSRGGKGLKTYKITGKTGCIIGARTVSDRSQLMIINSEGVLIRINVDSVGITSRATMGVRVMKVTEDTKLVALAKIADEDIEELEGEELILSEDMDTDKDVQADSETEDADEVEE